MDAKPSVGRQTWNWLDHRYKLGPLLEAVLHVDIPISARTFYLGGITLFFFMVQGITGILLTIYYQPTPEAAHKSILFIMNQVNFGWLIRSIHAWGANLMILFCVLHLLRVFFQAAYKAPREVTWVTGIVLLVATLGFGFTGYLLPWDQRAFWATTVGSEIAGAVPVVGQKLLILVRAGADVTARTLSRFFGMHVLVLPLSLVGALLVHIVLLHQQGLADPKREVANPNEVAAKDTASADSETTKKLPFFPNYILDELIAWYVMLAVLIILASLFPAGLEAPADPLRTPPHAKPEWYFLFLYQGLKLVPRLAGIAVPILGGLALVLLPFFDRNPYIAARRRPIAITIASVVLIAIVAFTIWGWRS